MYREKVVQRSEALSHLFFHCCFKDGQFTAEEIRIVSEKLVVSGLNKDLNFKDEIASYKAYRHTITDEQAYLNYLIETVQPTSTLALYSYCVELCISDALLGVAEEKLLQQIGHTLKVSTAEQELIIKLMIQRKTVELQRVF